MQATITSLFVVVQTADVKTKKSKTAKRKHELQKEGRNRLWLPITPEKRLTIDQGVNLGDDLSHVTCRSRDCRESEV